MAESQGPLVTTVAIVFAVLTFVAICLRLWARLLLVKSVGADDCKCLLLQKGDAVLTL